MSSMYPLPAAPPGLGVRQIRPLDGDGLLDLFERMSPESRRLRFLSPKSHLTERELIRLTDVDHARHEALVAVDPDGRIIGVARYAPSQNRADAAEIAVTVADDWQRRGIGTSLVRLLILRARANSIARLTATALWENHAARALVAKTGFRGCGSDREVVELMVELRSGARARPSRARLARR